MHKLLMPWLLVLVMAPSAWAQRIPISVEVGWNTVAHRLAPVPADSEIGKMSPDESLVVCFVYDQFSLAMPFWTSRQGFAICKAFEGSDTPDTYWLLKDQQRDKVASVLGIPEDQLQTPFFYYVPIGWIILAGIAVLIGVTSGPGPHKRFAHLWDNPEYRTVVARLLNLPGQELPVVFETIVLQDIPPDGMANLDESVAWLVQQGISQRKAHRDLDFLMGYLIQNRKIVVIPPADEV